MSESGRRGAAPHEGPQTWVSGAASQPAKSSLLLAVVFRLRLHLLDDRDVGKSSAEGALGRHAQLAWWAVAAPHPGPVVIAAHRLSVPASGPRALCLVERLGSHRCSLYLDPFPW